ncbi:MAG TPA: cyclic peptide export ABC transporter [Syntrophales bacterium]|nr:cyclic peptide export ABC transporter [Syntrophales bacterium]
MHFEVIKFLQKGSKQTGHKILIASLIAGISNGLIIVIINNASQNYAELNFRYLLLFALSVLALALTRKYTLYETSAIARTALSMTNVRIADKIRRSNLAIFEHVGKPRILTTLSEDTELIFEATRRIANGAVASIMLLFSFAYMAWLSSVAFWLSIAVIVSGVVVYLFIQRTINAELRVSEEKEHEFIDSLNHLLEGFKELKVNREKSDDLFHNYMEKISMSAREVRMGTESRFISSIIFSQVFVLILIASIIFLLPQMASSSPQLIVSLVAVLIFIVGPLGFVVEAVPVISEANVAVKKLGELEAIFDKADDIGQTSSYGPLQSKTTFDSITLERASFSYISDDNDKLFSVGPVDLVVKKGEIVFFVGGNGSGKTTLLKLLAGLYYPQQGVLYLDDVPVNMTNRDYYRNFFSIIFSDFHLFDRLYGIKNVDENRINRLLNETELSGKITYSNGKFSNINLSTGQRKRLALVVALMEDRPIYVLDEVAADQDPGFRKYFYEEMLQELKNHGKTIIAVSHDDRYFHVADRVIKMDFGSIVEGGRG